jgi:hypothetical protein
MKTLSQVNSKADYTFDPRHIGLKRPEIQARIARAISIWSIIDSLTVLVLGFALKGDIRIAAEMFMSITSAPASNAALKAAVRLGLKSDYAEIFNAIWTISGELVEARHRLAHWVLGYSKDIPRALLLFNPKDGFRRGASNLTFWRLGHQERFLRRRPTNKIRVLSAEYLDSLIIDFLAHASRIDAFLELLRLDETANVPASEIQQLYDRLYNEPRIHQTIARALGAPKNTPAVREPRRRTKRRHR